jgi:ubiquinol-cytochrome c reductase cytochrome c1 subunit
MRKDIFRVCAFKKAILLIGVWFFFFLPACYAEALSIGLDHVQVNLHDKKSIARGAQFFSKTCMVCHTLIYMRYDSLAKKNGVIYEKMPVNITKWPFDIRPPDLSLEVSRRGANWVYTYLHSFYLDSARPTGANNLVVHNTAMTNVLMPFQGQQIRLPDAQLGKNLYHERQWYDLLQQQAPGTMTPEQFDATITDVVNFLAYASTPYKLQQEKIGVGVLAFLLLFIVLTYLLKKAYWQDLKRSKKP